MGVRTDGSLMIAHYWIDMVCRLGYWEGGIYYHPMFRWHVREPKL